MEHGPQKSEATFHGSLLLFGTRGTGKTPLLRELFAGERMRWFDLLDPPTGDRLARNPESLAQQALGEGQKTSSVACA